MTAKQRAAIDKLWKLDAQQRDRILAHIERALMANQITQRVGKLRKVTPPQDHKVAKAFGGVSSWKPGRKKDQ